MINLINLLKNKRTIQSLGVLAFSLLIWFVGPLLAIADHVPFESEFSRIMTIIMIILLWVTYCLVMYLLAKKKNRQFIDGLVEGDDLESIEKTFVEALALLKTQSQRKSGSYLYELPWYAIIGAPGSGKTTALIHSGLNFPLAEKFGKQAIKGQQGTRNCDWWFTNDAILIDTAGRFVTQDSNQNKDAKEWQGFLQLLKKFRSATPLNGLLVTVSVTDLLEQKPDEANQHALKVRQRIKEINQQLGIQLPIYVLLTKTDLLAGFNEFFAKLTEQERSQVWGETFKWVNEEAEQKQTYKQFSTGFDELIKRLLPLRFNRLQDERDLQRRTAVLAFPQQLMLLKPAIEKFLETVFSESRFDNAFLLRGVYFTSGTQTGTPFDQLKKIYSQHLGIANLKENSNNQRGKSYFLTNLLKDVIFPEATLTGIDPIVARRNQLVKYSSMIGAGVISTLIIGFWLMSFIANKNAISEVDKKLESFNSNKIVPTDARSNFLAILPRLNALEAARGVYAQSNWTTGFGLYQGDKIQEQIDWLYDDILKRDFQGLITQRLKERMQGQEGTNLDVLYQLLKVYLMFTEPGRMNAQSALPWLKLDWENLFASAPETQAKLTQHSLNLLNQKEPEFISADQRLVKSVRIKLTQMPLANQLYSRFKSEALVDHSYDLPVAEALGINGRTVYMTTEGNELDSLIIPGLFTSKGYIEWFLKKAQLEVEKSSEQNWVLGLQIDNNPAKLQSLYEDVKRLYIADYQKTWADLLKRITIKPQQNQYQLIDTLDVLSRPDSPMVLLFKLVEKNTSLTKAAAVAADAQNNQQAVNNTSLQNAQILATSNVTDPVKALEKQFESINALVRGQEGAPSPVQYTLNTLKNLHDYFLAQSGGGLPPSGPNPVSVAKNELARLPETIAASLITLTQSGGQQVMSDAKKKLNDELKNAVTVPCQKIISSRYPFAKNSQQDVLLADFGKLFSANGLIDQFFNNYLKTWVDTSQTEWGEMNSEKSLGLSVKTIRQFQTAAKIRDVFFSAGGTLPQLRFELIPMSFDDRIDRFSFTIEGQEFVYKKGEKQTSKFQWPSNNSATGVQLLIDTSDGQQLKLEADGTWAIFRIINEFSVEATPYPELVNLKIQLQGYSANLQLRTESVSPFLMNIYQGFQCPANL